METCGKLTIEVDMQWKSLKNGKKDWKPTKRLYPSYGAQNQVNTVAKKNTTTDIYLSSFPICFCNKHKMKTS